MSKNVKSYRRVKFLWKYLAPVLIPLFDRLFGFHRTVYKPVEEPFLLVSNHTDGADPGFVLSDVRAYFRFVSSDHVMEKPFQRHLLHFIGDPIINHQKNSSDVVYNDMLETLKSGINVQLMAEARVTDSGQTGYISRRNATLVKEAGCGFITHRITGGYLTIPRWADERRKGPVFGEVVHHYTKAEVAQMTEDEVYEAMCRDLYVNAYDENRKAMHKYIAKDPAQSAEYVVYGCPKCGTVGKLHTKHDRMFCDCCDFEATVDDYGFWHSKDMAWDNIPEWNEYQKQLIYDLIDGATDPDEVLVEHDGQLVYTMDDKGDVHLADENGVLRLYKDSVEVLWDGKRVRVKGTDVKKVSYSSKGTLILVTEERDFRIKTKVPRAPNIYVVAIRYMNGKKSV
ncbi:MAG: hypothetical protein J6T17_00280 [Clostridia bacterium]|nr:hypothetical protein [Clostridia bacterium]